jgi:hypothetical protein
MVATAERTMHAWGTLFLEARPMFLLSELIFYDHDVACII